MELLRKQGRVFPLLSTSETGALDVGRSFRVLQRDKERFTSTVLIGHY